MSLSKPVKTVFGLIATIVVIFLAWQMIFNKGGIIVTGYNAVVGVINTQWEKVSGNSELIPEWNAETNGKGGTIDTGND